MYILTNDRLIFQTAEASGSYDFFYYTSPEKCLYKSNMLD